MDGHSGARYYADVRTLTTTDDNSTNWASVSLDVFSGKGSALTGGRPALGDKAMTATATDRFAEMRIEEAIVWRKEAGR